MRTSWCSLVMAGLFAMPAWGQVVVEPIRASGASNERLGGVPTGRSPFAAVDGSGNTHLAAPGRLSTTWSFTVTLSRPVFLHDVSISGQLLNSVSVRVLRAGVEQGTPVTASAWMDPHRAQAQWVPNPVAPWSWAQCLPAWGFRLPGCADRPADTLEVTVTTPYSDFDANGVNDYPPPSISELWIYASRRTQPVLLHTHSGRNHRSGWVVMDQVLTFSKAQVTRLVVTLTKTHATYFPRRVMAFRPVQEGRAETQGSDVPWELAYTPYAPIGTKIVSSFDMNIETDRLIFSTLWSSAASYNPKPMDWSFEVWGFRLP